MDHTEIERARGAATSLASDLGLAVEETHILQTSNRLTVRLVPCDVVVRVAAPGRRNLEVAEFEVEIARRFEEAGSPTGLLDPRFEPRVHSRDGFTLTFWSFYDGVDGGEIDPVTYADALTRLHVSIRQMDVAAPHFTDRVGDAQAIVADRSLSPDLNDTDRGLLVSTLHDFRGAVLDRCADEQLLHGEPHPGNVLNSSIGPRFIDFESCCRGPVEFDIAHAPDVVGDHYDGADPVLLRHCRILKLAMIAAWRADRDDSLPNGREMQAEMVDQIRDLTG